MSFQQLVVKVLAEDPEATEEFLKPFDFPEPEVLVNDSSEGPFGVFSSAASLRPGVPHLALWLDEVVVFTSEGRMARVQERLSGSLLGTHPDPTLRVVKIHPLDTTLEAVVRAVREALGLES